MQLFSSPKSQFPLFLPSTNSNPNPNPSPNSRSLSRIPIKFPSSSLPLLRSPPSSKTPLQEEILCSDSDDEDGEAKEVKEIKSTEGLLEVRRPVKEASVEEEEEEREIWSPLNIDTKLSEIAKKISIFEPERVESSVTSGERPLGVNLELGLYRAKVLTRKFHFQDAEKILSKCILFWPEDGRAYVALGKLLKKQSKYAEARSVYERGCQATQGENPYIWQRAVQANPKNRFAWHVWALFEVNQGNTDKGRKLLTIGHALNPRDPVILQSLALLEYKHSTANLARVLFRRASELDSRHQPVWIAWGWMEWKEGNLRTARELYQRALSIDSTSESAARCLQAWGVLEQRAGNLSAGRRLFRSSLNINSQSYITWMTCASLEEDQGNPIRAEEIRNLYIQQRTEVVNDASWIMGFMDIFDPALDSIKRLLNLKQNSNPKSREILRIEEKINGTNANSSSFTPSEESGGFESSDFDLDAFMKEKLSLDVSKLDVRMEIPEPNKIETGRRLWRSDRQSVVAR